MPIRTIGIDLGTTNTVAAMMRRGQPREIQNRHGSYSTPSALAVGLRGELLVGEDARSRLQGVVMSFKRFMGTDKQIQFNGREYSPMELSVLVLRNIKKDMESVLGEPIPRAVITVPAWFNERATTETREAGRMAGFFVTRTFQEPMAAALAYDLDREDSDPKTILVYDLGGGTFDIAVLMNAPGTFLVLDHEGDVWLGGDDFDDLIVNYIRQNNRTPLGDDEETRLKLKFAAEKAKIELTFNNSTTINLPALGPNRVNINSAITSEQFERMIMPWIVGPRPPRDNKLAMSTMELVQKAITESTSKTIHNIVLVGGSSYIPLVNRVLAEKFGKEKISKIVNPMLCVAYGAAIQANMMNDILCPECHAENSLDALKCTGCGYPLVGEEKIECPECFMPSPVSETTCWKCGTILRRHDGGGDDFRPPPGDFKECPNHHRNPLNAEKCRECDHVFDSGGIRCPKGHLNKAGATICQVTGCGEIINPPIGILPKNRLVQVHTGGLEIVAKKGTQFPTKVDSRLHATFKTPEADYPEITFILYEGDGLTAAENEWLGELTLNDLPPGLRKDTPIDVYIDLDKDGTMWFEACLADEPDKKVKAHIEHCMVSRDKVNKLKELIKQAKQLYERNEKEDFLDDSERTGLGDLLAKMEQAHQKTSMIEARLGQWENEMAKYQKVFEIHQNIVVASYTVDNTAEYLTDAQKDKMKKLISEAQQAHNNGDRNKWEKLSEQIKKEQEALGIDDIVYATFFSTDPRLSEETRTLLRNSLAQLKKALIDGNKGMINAAMTVLRKLNNQAIKELQALGEKVYLPGR